MTIEKKPVFYSPDNVKRGNISEFSCVFLITIEMVDEIDPIEIEIILN